MCSVSAFEHKKMHYREAENADCTVTHYAERTHCDRREAEIAT